MNYLVLFAHYDKHGLVDDYVVEYVKGLKEIAKDIVFISVSNISEPEQKKLEPYVKAVINKKNEGYDFGSWQAGFRHIGYENLQNYDGVVICNDSCYGPLYSLKESFEKMKKMEAWSITAGYSYCYHLQSYFVVFNKKTIITSSWFKDWFEKCKIEKDKYGYINKYEVGLTKLLKKHKIKIDSYVKIPKTTLFQESVLIQIKFIFLYTRLIFFRLIRIIAIMLKLIKRKKKRTIHKIYIKNWRIISYDSNMGETFLSYRLRAIFHPFHSNPSICMALDIIRKYQCPLIKVMALRKDDWLMEGKILEPDIDNYEHILKEYTNYNPDLIKNHLARIKKNGEDYYSK